MKRSKQVSGVALKKMPFGHRRKRKVPLREWFSDPDFYECESRDEDV